MIRRMLIICNFLLLYKKNNSTYKLFYENLKNKLDKKDLRTIMRILNYINKTGTITSIQKKYLVRLQNG